MNDMSPNAVIARNVRLQRRARGWTQDDLAERLSERDTKRWTVSMVSDAESAAADPGALRFDKPEHRVCRNGGFNSVSASLEYLDGGGHGMRVGGSHHCAVTPGRLRHDAGAFTGRRGCIVQRSGYRRAAGEQQGGEDGRGMPGSIHWITVFR